MVAHRHLARSRGLRSKSQALRETDGERSVWGRPASAVRRSGLAGDAGTVSQGTGRKRWRGEAEPTGNNSLTANVTTGTFADRARANELGNGALRVHNARRLRRLGSGGKKIALLLGERHAVCY